jgi:hypothetical protein
MAGHVWEAGGRGQEGARENCGWPTGPDRGGGGFNGGGIRLRVSNHSILYLLGVLYDFSAADMPFVPLKGKITQFQEDFCRKGTQRTHRQELMLFFFVIFAFSCGQFNLVAAGRAGRFAPFCGKIISSDYP